ncbi:heparanase-like protein 3 [Amaranthus tricolor]|uniref:heparanase-like protein 3 n=1 Tax=Amaranthus tricolor TaxID=29722 RepID=UPI00258A32CF|nr:heparanase-like protein 3 [Amaranthus tricolor]XP_057522825.1 heparanase-like protein 3 [Amaranthus tricolor]
MLSLAIHLSSVISLVGLGCLLYFIFNHSVEYPKHQTVVVFFNSTAKIGQTDDDYICATLDWWPSDKCDYGSCSWGMASLLNLDLNNTILSNAVKAFAPLKIRMGGTLQDKLTYQTDEEQSCNPFVRNSSQLLGFSEGCLPMARWDDLNRFFKETGTNTLVLYHWRQWQPISPSLLVTVEDLQKPLSTKSQDFSVILLHRGSR